MTTQPNGQQQGQRLPPLQNPSPFLMGTDVNAFESVAMSPTLQPLSPELINLALMYAGSNSQPNSASSTGASHFSNPNSASQLYMLQLQQLQQQAQVQAASQTTALLNALSAGLTNANQQAALNTAMFANNTTTNNNTNVRSIPTTNTIAVKNDICNLKPSYHLQSTGTSSLMARRKAKNKAPDTSGLTLPDNTDSTATEKIAAAASASNNIATGTKNTKTTKKRSSSSLNSDDTIGSSKPTKIKKKKVPLEDKSKLGRSTPDSLAKRRDVKSQRERERRNTVNRLFNELAELLSTSTNTTERPTVLKKALDFIQEN